MKRKYNICILGPENTGKSEMTRTLAAYYNADYIYEYARLYLEKNGPDYTIEDVSRIGNEQWQLEKELKEQSASDIRFFDTSQDVIRVWQEIVFNTCDENVLKRIAVQQFDLYLLGYPDLPWVYDPLREYPDDAERIRQFYYYRSILIAGNTPFHVFRGLGEERYKSCKDYIDRHITGHRSEDAFNNIPL